MTELTEREKQILERLTEGWTNRQIAAELGIPVQTVKNRLTIIYLKIGVENRIQAAVKWFKWKQKGF